MAIKRLTESELDEVIRRNRIPRGCDQQGRHPEAAEAATEVGADDDEDDPLRAARGVVWAVIASLLIWAGGVLCALVYMGALK